MEFSRWNIAEGRSIPAERIKDEWHLVIDTAGGGGEFWVSVGQAQDGRYVITGLHMSAGEITARMLRELQPAAIIAAMRWRATGSAPPASVGGVSPISGLARFEGMTEHIEAHASRSPSLGDDDESPAPRRGPQPPNEDMLREFARVYLAHAEYSKGPMTLTARDLQISRATANRWADRCRALGLLPVKP